MAWAQETTADSVKADAGAATSAAEAVKRKVALSREAGNAAQAAQNAAKAASTALDKAAATKTAVSEKKPDVDLKKLADDAAVAARSAANEADKAAKAAIAAEDAISVQPAKSTAGGAAAAASRAALRASDAAKAAETAALAAIGAVVSAKAAETAAETLKAASFASEAASQTTVVAQQASMPDLPVTDEGDDRIFGALRARLAGGAIFFNGAPQIVTNADNTTARIQSNQFGQAAMYLAFESQPRLFGFGKGCHLTDDERDRIKAAAKSSDPDLRARIVRDTHQRQKERCEANPPRMFDRFYVDPFVNVRLTAIPVTGQQLAGPVQTPDQSFLQSQKAAQIQFGGLASYNFGGFAFNKQDFHWGVGPIVRGMFQSVADTQRSLRVWNLNDDLYDAQTYGLRATLYGKAANNATPRSQTWMPTAYFDMSWGKFQNFERVSDGTTVRANACLKDPAKCLKDGPPPESEFNRVKPLRMYIEGRVYLKYLHLGFDLNNGEGPDDLRFIGGVTVTLDRFFRRQ